MATMILFRSHLHSAALTKYIEGHKKKVRPGLTMREKYPAGNKELLSW